MSADELIRVMPDVRLEGLKFGEGHSWVAVPVTSHGRTALETASLIEDAVRLARHPTSAARHCQ